MSQRQQRQRAAQGVQASKRVSTRKPTGAAAGAREAVRGRAPFAQSVQQRVPQAPSVVHLTWATVEHHEAEAPRRSACGRSAPRIAWGGESVLARSGSQPPSGSADRDGRTVRLNHGPSGRYRYGVDGPQPPENKGLNLPKGTEVFALRAIFINVPFAG